LIWERTRPAQRLRPALRGYFPAALEAFEDLAATDTLELIFQGPDPASQARSSSSQISSTPGGVPRGTPRRPGRVDGGRWGPAPRCRAVGPLQGRGDGGFGPRVESEL